MLKKKSTLRVSSIIISLTTLYKLVKKKWAVNSAFMALYAFATVVICWVCWAYKMSFGERLLPFWGRAEPTLGQEFLIGQAALPSTAHRYRNGTVEMAMAETYYPMASMVWFKCVFPAITLVLVTGSLLGRMNIKAWMAFVPLWLTLSYTVGAFNLWGGGFLFHWGVIDYSSGYVIHLSSGIAGFTVSPLTGWFSAGTAMERTSLAGPMSTRSAMARDVHKIVQNFNMYCQSSD